MKREGEGREREGERIRGGRRGRERERERERNSLVFYYMPNDTCGMPIKIQTPKIKIIFSADTIRVYIMSQWVQAFISVILSQTHTHTHTHSTSICLYVGWCIYIHKHYSMVGKAVKRRHGVSYEGFREYIHPPHMT